MQGKKLLLHVAKFIPFFVIFILTVLEFGPTLFPPQGKMLYGSDVYDAYFYWKEFLRHSFLSGSIPFWNPYNFSGTPFLAHPNINIYYPPTWLFILISPQYSFSLYFFIHIVWAGVTMYWLARQYTDRWGALVSAVIFAFGGYFATRVWSGHLEYVDTASWIPLVFGVTRKTLQEPSSKRNYFITSVAFTILLLSGNELFFLFSLELICLYLLYYFLIKRKCSLKDALQKIIKLSVALVGAIGLAACGIIPRLVFIMHSIRSSGLPYSVAGLGSLPMEGLALFINPFFWGKQFPENYTYNGPWPDLTLYTHYVGILPVLSIIFFVLILILSKLLKKKLLPIIHPEMYFFLFIVIPIFLYISFGNQVLINLHELLWRFTPFYKGIRLPARHLFLVMFSLSVCVGMIIGLVRRSILKLMILIVIPLDLFLFSRQFFRLSPYPTSSMDQKLTTLLKGDSGFFRLLPDFTVVSPVRRDFDFGSSSIYKVFSTSDYNSMILDSYYRFIDLSNKKNESSMPMYNVEVPPLYPWASSLDFLNIRYVLSDKIYDAVNQSNNNKFSLLLDENRFRLYRNKDVLLRFFLVRKVKTAQSKTDLENQIRMEKIDYKNEVILKEPLDNTISLDESCIEKYGNVDIVSYELNKISIQIKVSCNYILSSSEIYYPSWRAKIDGMNTKILLSNLAFRSIYIPKGNHMVEFYYYPQEYAIGLGITFSFVVIFFLLYRKGINSYK